MRLLLLVAALATGCSTTAPIVGQFKSGEMFRGEATGRLDGSGALTVRSESGFQCSGRFQYGGSRTSGEGRFDCTDGRTGDFYFTSSGMEGEGFGKLSDGEQFRFRFGDPEALAAMAASVSAMAKAAEAANRPPPMPTTIVVSPPLIQQSVRTTCSENLTRTGIDCTSR